MRQDIGAGMLTELARHGWAKHQAVNKQGNICASEAFSRAVETTAQITSIPAAASRIMWAELSDQAGELYPERKKEDGVFPWDLIDFNDHQDTTLEDLHLVIKHWAG